MNSLVTISLRPELKAYLDEQVRAGRFADVDDAVNTAIEAAKSSDLSTLRKEIQIGIDAADRREYSTKTAEQIIGEGHQRMSQRKV